MKQFLLATALIAVAVVAFFGGRAALVPSASAVAAANPLGDLSAMAAIVTDVQGIAKTGDLPGAKARIADLETAWDDGEATLRPKDPEAWGRVDAAIDGALSALRAGTPDPAEVDTTLSAVQAILADPGQAGGSAAGGVVMIGDIAVTDAEGHPTPCETMLTSVQEKRAAASLTAEAAARVDDLVTRATERCNADDDKTSDSFSAQALQAMATN